jgi:glyoxylase-like metal-dependent hydrolase (beta-lactamase superfamily II)
LITSVFALGRNLYGPIAKIAFSSTDVMKLLVDSARKNLLPNRDRMIFVEDGKESIKGVSVVSSRGHTPGHTAYLLSSAGQNFLFTGDFVTNTAISFKPSRLGI